MLEEEALLISSMTFVYVFICEHGKVVSAVDCIMLPVGKFSTFACLAHDGNDGLILSINL